MRILAIADVEEAWLGERFDAARLADVDLIISCGDLPARYLTRIVDLSNKPLFYVPGNHDAAFAGEPVPGCIDLDGRIESFHGLRILGLGGSLPYNDRVYGFTEREMRWRVAKMVLLAQATGGADIVVTHAPAAGYGDLDDLPHQGFECFNGLLDRLHPRYLLHGHVHMEYGRIARELAHPSGARLVNCCGHRFIEV